MESKNVVHPLLRGVISEQKLQERVLRHGEIVKREVAAWQKARSNKGAKINWQFTAEDARIKLRRLYPTLDV